MDLLERVEGTCQITVITRSLAKHGKGITTHEIMKALIGEYRYKSIWRSFDITQNPWIAFKHQFPEAVAVNNHLKDSLSLS